MKLAYLLNSYPMTSTTFIRREIHAIEAQGIPVIRFGVRHWSEKLVDPEDLEEQRRTEYLLTGNMGGLFQALLVEIFVNPVGVLRTVPRWLQLLRAGGGFVRHAGYFLQAMRFRQRTRQLGIEHVHVHFSTNAASVAMLARRLGGAPYSFTVHGPDELIDPKSNLMGGKVADAAFVVAITDYCRGRIAAEADADQEAKIVIIPCGIRLDDYRHSPLPDEPPSRLICVGRLCANKGQSLIPAAVAEVREEFPELVIELVGDGEDRGLIEREIARYEIADMFQLSGWCANDQVTQRIAEARALLLPSFAEGLPIVLMEAFAMERPVITTRIAGIPELVDSSCGWIMTPGRHEELVGAIRDVLRTDAERLRAMASEGRRRVEERHDIDGTATALISAFRESVRGLSAREASQMPENTL